MRWDVLVAGAGPAGAVAALVLARRGRRVGLVDDAAAPAPGSGAGPGEGPARKVGESLPGAARPLLRDLGLLDRVEAGVHLPSAGNASAWGSSELRVTDALRDPHGAGWHLDRPRFDADLRAAAEEAGVALRPGRVFELEREGDGWRVEVAGEPVEARHLIDATGRHAAVARRLGARRTRDEPLVALVAWGETPDDDRDTRTLIEAVPDGWWYTARLPGGSRVVVLHVDAEDAAEVLRAQGAWVERLAETVHVRRALAGSDLAAVAPRGTEASGARLDRFAGDGWLAVGDAALSFDPLSSQGMFDALYTGLRGAEAVDAALGGDTAPARAYGERLESVRAAYLEHHRTYYAAETRWPDRPFWSRRQGARPPRSVRSSSSR